MPADSFLEGFFFVRDHNEFGHLSYLDGQYSSMGWREYFPKTFWYKTLIPTMILFALSLLVMLKIRANYLEEIFIFLLPIIYFLISINSKLNIGIRHILIIYPFIYLSIGRLAKLEFKNIYFNYLTKIFIIVLLSWVVVESIYYYPSDIAYFNQIAGGPQNGYRHLADSNIDWGQDIKRLRLYMDKKNYNYSLLQCDGSAFYDYYGINTRKAGDMSLIKNDYITLRIFCFLMPSEEAEKDPLFQKLKKMQPIDNVGHSILIYKINN
ncbi:MAG: hypothetical protein M1338_03630 [Patescibacteria group bacterium]|nr:hypothetical protein [Patescibacteria group bacterium]